MKLTFLGATEGVTGSRYLIEHDTTKMLIDCGLFQGPYEVSKRNKDPFPIEPSSIDAVIITHAHIDHTGYIPALVKQGFKGPIYCSPATYELCSILLLDSAHIQEEEAREEREKGKDVELLYTVKDAEYALSLFKPTAYDTELSVGPLRATLIRAGHILGASFVVVTDGTTTLTFSGDLGRPHQMIMKEPSHITDTDYLVLDSTYGDRLHPTSDPLVTIEDVVNKMAEKQGVLVIPAFAVGRAQAILYILYQLQQEKRIPDIPVYLDSPMAIRVTKLFCRFQDEHTIPDSVCKDVFENATYTRTEEESKRLTNLKGPAIIVSASGMATGGRVLYHLAHLVEDAKNTILFVGFQAPGTLGRSLLDGMKKLTIHDKTYDVRATIQVMETLSAHADYNEILAWLEHFTRAPKQVFLTHGERHAEQALKESIEQQFGWNVVIPAYEESFSLE